ncbi:MAG: VWA domain-containing protein [Bacilli bacterium]
MKNKGNSVFNNFVKFSFVFLAIVLFSLVIYNSEQNKKYLYNGTLHILSSYDNKIAMDDIIKYANDNNSEIVVDYMGDLDIIDELNHNSENYDAVWISNSMWLYMLDNPYLTSNSASISISPVVFGIKKSKAKSLGLMDSNVTNNMIVNLIKNKQIKYVMSSVTATNTGATAYLGFLSSLAGNPEVLTEEMLNDKKLIQNLKDVFSGVQRVSGDEDYLEEMFLNNDEYEAIISSEASLININKKLREQNKEELYLIYPSDGVAINDSTFAFIGKDNKEKLFLDIQKYLLSENGQKMLANLGYRTWYGGVNSNADKNIFNPEYGIDTSKYLNVTKFPSKKVITAAINLYIEELRKPTHVVFCLDYSGSMYGSGKEQLVGAMKYILDYDQASKDNLQFSKYDKITVIPFGTNVYGIWNSVSGHDTIKLIENIDEYEVGGSTALYDAIITGLDILDGESDEYTKTIIAMTDGVVNVGTIGSLREKYNNIQSDIPIYSITFGDASYDELNNIANLSNAKVFDGKKDLLKAFKEVRGYN